MTPRVEQRPAQPAERVLYVTQCWFCGRKWAPKPLPEHDRVVIEEGFCPPTVECRTEDEFFAHGKRTKSRGVGDET